jgi:predicted alpha-1,6-mannanase (GH76 family)
LSPCCITALLRRTKNLKDHMRDLYVKLTLTAILSVNGIAAFAQASGITSGATYAVAANTKLLEIRNSATVNAAPAGIWTDTHSAAQRWVLQRLGKGVYTLANVASKKYLHLTAVTADSTVIDQTDVLSDDAKWTIRKAGGGYQIRPLSAPGSLLVAAGSSDGTTLSLSKSARAGMVWTFRKEKPQPGSEDLTVLKKTFDDWYNGYKIEEHKGFWDQAEMIETVLDAYETTKDPVYKAKFEALFNNFLTNHKKDWMYNKYNDDIAWAVLFSVRGYLNFKDKRYLDQAKDQYDKMYKRAFTNSYGGGLIWYETKTSKNACIEGPASVAACYLAEATGDSTYYDKAVALYSWSKLYLFNPATGKVKDNVDLNKRTGQLRTSNISFTYNQGTFLGAATMLYKHTKEAFYLAEAEKIAQYTRDSIYRGQVMNNEDSGNDLPGFKGIFARYARKYTQETGKTDLVDWLRQNAEVAYNNRNTFGIIQTKWATRTPEVPPVLKKGFGPSTAVSLLFNTYPLMK